ncbi:hypothetical protein QE152_g19959 [Popillia japonica]|uniref:Uncharacterized protein n=1 Tax=Popillia japonica TaxID=7064 RepID=A0AAW1KQ55_POPJA
MPVVTGKEIADKFVSHFCEPIRDACCNNRLFDDYMTTHGRITSNTQVQSFCLPDVTSQEVDDIIRQLDVKKATGADGVMTSDQPPPRCKPSWDLTTAKIQWMDGSGAGDLVLGSAYLPFDQEGPPPTTEVRALVAYAGERKRDLLLGCDANAHHSHLQPRK